MKRTAVRFASALFGVALILTAEIAAAEQVDVGGGVYVTKKTYFAPANEQPFFGFQEKTATQLAADRRLLAWFNSKGYSMSYAFNRAMANGWRALSGGKLDIAARRFNQAHLIDPSHSAVFHGFAIVAHVRFRDADYAEELFSTGAKMDNRMRIYMADYGRFMLVIGKKREALPILEEAVRDAPDDATAWSNLAFARLHDDQRQKACEAAERAKRLSPPETVVKDLKILIKQAKCVRRA